MSKNIHVNYNCSICNGTSIIYKIFGMPNTHTIARLESFSGLDVKIMGCVPPYADEATYLFQCKVCKNEWFEYEELEKTFFEFLYETYPGQPMPKIVYEGGLIHLEPRENYQYLCVPNEKQTKLFWNQVDKFDVWSWKNKYVNDGINDGFGWELKIKRKGKKKKKINGFNSFPKDEKFFDKFLKTIADFSDWELNI